MTIDGRFGLDEMPIFVIDQSRCIGCEACVQACMECGTHRGQSLIQLDRFERSTTTQTAAVGGAFASMGAAAPAPQAGGGYGMAAGAEESNAFATEFPTLDFLASAAVVLDNVRPDAEGVVRIPLDALGAAVGLSPAHLQRRFRETFGLSPAEYRAQRRLATLKRGLRAKNHLKACDTPGVLRMLPY